MGTAHSKGQQLCTVRTTPYGGGRGVYAQTYITAGTCVQRCSAPYAYVIARKFRKEVCAWCFKYAFEHGKNTWSWKYDPEDAYAAAAAAAQSAHSEKAPIVVLPVHEPPTIVEHRETNPTSLRDNGAGAGAGVGAGISFCSAECRHSWCREMDVGGLHAALNATVEKLAVRIPHKDRAVLGTADASPSAVAPPSSDGDDEGLDDDLTLLRTLQRHWTCTSNSATSDVLLSSVSSHTPIMPTHQTLSHQEQLDMIWKQAEQVYNNNNIPSSKQHSRHFQPCREDRLTEFEVDTSRFVISALVRHFSEENPAYAASTTQLCGGGGCISEDRHLPQCGPGVCWSGMLDLQNNEIETALQKPVMTAAHLRVYGFVRRVVEITLQASAARPRAWNRLRTYVDKSDFVRGLLGRDHGNVFGIWDSAHQDDGEMLGWGMYVQGSYFNHDCSPNIKNRRTGRAMNFYAIRDIMPGEEMCIAYVNVADPVINRRAELKKEWYFDCICARCQAEQRPGSITSIVDS